MDDLRINVLYNWITVADFTLRIYLVHGYFVTLIMDILRLKLYHVPQSSLATNIIPVPYRIIKKRGIIGNRD